MSCKKNPKWLDAVLFWTIIPPMIVGVMVWEMTRGWSKTAEGRKP